jgi:hypothetical protein
MSMSNSQLGLPKSAAGGALTLGVGCFLGVYQNLDSGHSISALTWAVVAFAALVFIWGLLSLALHEFAGPESSARQIDHVRLQRALAHQRTALSNAHVEFASPSEKDEAARLSDTFRAAGWDVSNQGNVPLEGASVRDRIDGTRVSGFNAAVVDAVAGALEECGYARVTREKKPDGLDPQNPKVSTALARAYVVVGHQEQPPIGGPT